MAEADLVDFMQIDVAWSDLSIGIIGLGGSLVGLSALGKVVFHSFRTRNS